MARHNALRDSLAQAFWFVGMRTETEKIVPSETQTLRPADVFVQQQKLCIDASVT
eukprot:CAMPEP_0184716202 /NCGR_PEP_ID=MMETSP0314-20130426/5982_1 /TAXON_ID=38298 /ORGANISM="Rhodella maculata, Strain CCMP 736" /LENGTH=54 /DNA_ID=CAMNT_0027179549 /DNA_START=128 /DNA_END=288 /DNA_ORIENTATION=-